ncbi:MAG: M48 family metallopeptidase [Bacteroidota bacterium]|nr:M48 family metallopeptidase [Bacteroidota bacterium]
MKLNLTRNKIIMKDINIKLVCKIFIVFLLLGPSLKVYAQVDIINEVMKQANKLNETLLEMTALTDEEENNIGKEIYAEVLKSKTVISDYKYNVNAIFNKLLKQTARKKIKYQYTVIRENEVNAYALAGGKMLIHSKLIDFVDTEDELAFVIAHEIAHNELKHCIKKIQYAVRANDINPTLGQVVNKAYQIYDMPFSKDEEFAADELGVKILKKAGYKKEGAIRFFEKLAVLEKKYGQDDRDALNDFVSSHPTAEKRKLRVQKM